MYRAIFVNLPLVLAYVWLCAATVKIQNFTAMETLACSGADVVFTSESNIMCSVLCEQTTPPCTGFTYNAAENLCVGCRDLPVQTTTPDPNTVFYVPNGRKWAYPCGLESSCTDANQECMDGFCVCTAGYSFSFTIWTCTTGCDPYGDTFQKYRSHVILEENNRMIFGIDLEDCLQRCRIRPDCKSIEHGFGACHIQLVTALDFPSKYTEVEGIVAPNPSCGVICSGDKTNREGHRVALNDIKF